MAAHSISRDTMLEGLQDIRLPSDAAGGFLAELVAIAGLGLALALLISFAMPLFARARARPQPKPGLAARIAALRDLPDEDRAIALLHLMREQELAASDIYTRDGFPTPAALEAALLQKAGTDA